VLFLQISYSNQGCSDISASDIYETDVCPVERFSWVLISP